MRTVSISEPAVVVRHSDEVVSAGRLRVAPRLPQEPVGEVQLSVKYDRTQGQDGLDFI